MLYLHRHIGGLETIIKSFVIIWCLHRHIGGLEKTNTGAWHTTKIHRHIGGLEIEKQYQDKIAKLEAELVERDKQRDSDLVKSEALKLASSLSDNEHNQAILQMLIEKRLTAENGQVKVVDDLGNATISTIADLKNEISTSGKFDSLITGTKASGVGATGQFLSRLCGGE